MTEGTARHATITSKRGRVVDIRGMIIGYARHIVRELVAEVTGE